MDLQRTVSCVWHALHPRRDDAPKSRGPHPRAERATEDARTWLRERQLEAQRRLDERREA